TAPTWCSSATRSGSGCARWGSDLQGSGAADDLAVQDRQPAVVGLRPLAPAVGDAPQVAGGGGAGGQGLLGECGALDAFGPHAAPPGAVVGGGEAPGGRGGGDLGEPGGAGPREQPPPGVRLAAVAARHLLVELHPGVERGDA